MSGHAQLEEDVLRRVLSVARQLGASADLHEILTAIIDTMRDTLDAERATVFEYDAGREELFTTVAHGVADTGGGDTGGADTGGGDEIRIPTGTGLAGECARSRKTINVTDAYDDPRFNPEIDRRLGFRTRSILTVPLLDHEGVLIGVAQVLNKRGGPFVEVDEQLADALAAQAAVALRRGRLIADHIVRLRLEADLELARTIQQGTFPERLPVVPGFDLAAWSAPADETGGDAYDVIGLPVGSSDRGDAPSDAAILLLADATGHGVGPAISVTQLRSMLRMASRLGIDLPVILQHVNEQLCQDLPAGRFITAWLAVVEAEGGRVRALSAGQGPILLYRRDDDSVDEYDSDAVPLGVLESLGPLEPHVMHLREGDILAAISDGIFEAMDESGTQFDKARVIDAIRAARDGPAAGIVAAVRDAVDCFAGSRPPDDDRTMVIVKRI